MKVEIGNIGKQMISAIEVIEQFEKKNDIHSGLDIDLDFDSDDLGYYYSTDKKIYVNPMNCDADDSVNFRYIDCWSVDRVIIHEYCHYLIFTYKLLDLYIELNDHLYLNSYSHESDEEELAEIISLYILNPHLLKRISEIHFKFVKNKFKSPTKCGPTAFEYFYWRWSEETRRECYKKWKIKINS